jgi:class 3 adenylate cyclase/TolB-like protein/tetratricopeptide (TPR) repeat protein
MPESRKIAAILAADVVGYSRLASVDEDRTLARLRALRRDLIDPAIAVHNGRVVKRTGDGVLVEFRSVVDAARCAIEMQRGMTERNAGWPLERRIEFRVGIHLGDVVEESDGDLMGNGVNIAARLEGMARPGAICLSEDAYRQVKGRFDLPISDLGETYLKNIAEPIRAYLFELDNAGQGERITAQAPSELAQPGKPSRLSIIVLPFVNRSSDPEQEFVADILTDELTTYLSRIPGTFVIASRSAFTYKHQTCDVKQIGRELGVRYVFDGSVQASGQTLRVHARLIDADTGAYLWADQFDSTQIDRLQMQDEIVTRIARSLQIRLVEVDAARLARAQPVNPDAELVALRAEAIFLAHGVSHGKGWQEWVCLCETALQMDSRNLRVLAMLALSLAVRVHMERSSDRQADLNRAEKLTRCALDIDPNYYLAHHANAMVLVNQRRFSEAISEDEHALSLNPSYTGTYTGLSIAHLDIGEPLESIKWAERALQLSPRDPLRWTFHSSKARAYFMLGEDRKALESCRQSDTLNPGQDDLLFAAALALIGEADEARSTLGRYLSSGQNTGRTIAHLKAQQLSDHPVFLAYRERLYDGLRKAGMPE